ncbi:MAG: GNAT family N-acetyltransferase [Bacteroidia bacterium]|nr:GNAT family N-acetyltransferase [Bacteroidia bacterium]
MPESEILAQANEFIRSQGFHVMTREDIPKFIDCAAESYGSVSYPLNDYFTGHPCTKEELREMWLFNLTYFYSRAVIYSDSPECNAWLLWIPPGCKGVSVMNFLRYGGIRMTRKLGLASLRRIMHYEDYSASVRMKATGGKEWYWYNLVVRPEAQGKHLVGKLLRPMLEFCADKGKPVYLETHSEKNVEIYRHFGFEVANDSPLPGTEMTHWGMVRKA